MSDSEANGIPSELTQIEWEDMIYTLQEECCVLFLGPGAYHSQGGGDISEGLRSFLDADNPDHRHIRQYNEDGFMLFRKNRFQQRVAGKIRDYYNQDFPETEALFAKLARIPFSIVFLISPDNLLTRTFDNLGLEYHWDFFFRNRKGSETFDSPNGKVPLIYNLLGNIEEPESLVLTYQDFFTYLESAVNGNSMSAELHDELEKAVRFVFLGLPYEKWYFQLVLRVLSMESEKFKEAERHALLEFEDPRVGTVYQKDFRMEFLPAAPELFINTLYQECERSGILRPVSPQEIDQSGAPFDGGALKEKIAMGRTGTALQELKKYLDGQGPGMKEQANSLVVLRNRYNLLQQRERKGTIYPQDLEVENNQIVESLLNLIERVEGS